MRKLNLLLVFLLLFAALGCQQPAQKGPGQNVLTVHFIDVGQGDAILIQSPDGENMLIDGGEREAGVMDYLRKNKVNSLDVLVATHPHSDHIGGLIEVLKTIPVKKALIDGQTHTSGLYEDFLDAISQSPAALHQARRGNEITVGRLTFKILNPQTSFLQGLNNNSVVLRLAYGNILFLFPGDAETEAEKSILSYTTDLKSTVLKVGHHGSKTASSDAFLAAVRPEVAIYMAGKDNSFGHPHQETIARFKQLNARVYGTDNYGTIIVSTDGTSYSVRNEKGAELK